MPCLIHHILQNKSSIALTSNHMKSQMERNCFGKTVRKYYSLQIHALPPIVEAAYLPNLNRNTEEKNSPAMKIDLVIDTDTKIF